MAHKNIDRKAIVTAAKKMVEDKKAILDYSNGKISKKELNGRGVRLAMPL